MSHIDSLFEGSRDASMAGGRGDHTDVGVYKVKIKDLFVKISNDPAKSGAMMFIVEYTFMESNNPKHAPGSSGSAAWALKPDPYKYGIADCKRLFFAACPMLDPADPADHVLVELLQKASLDPSSPAVATLKAAPYEIDDAKGMIVGQVVGLEVVPAKKKDGSAFTKRLWSTATAAAA